MIIAGAIAILFGGFIATQNTANKIAAPLGYGRRRLDHHQTVFLIGACPRRKQSRPDFASRLLGR